MVDTWQKQSAIPNVLFLRALESIPASVDGEPRYSILFGKQLQKDSFSIVKRDNEKTSAKLDVILRERIAHLPHLSSPYLLTPSILDAYFASAYVTNLSRQHDLSIAPFANR